MLQGVPAFIMGVLFAALFYPAPVRQRGLCFAPPSALRGSIGSATITTPVGRAHPYPKHTYNFLVFGAPASLIGSELSSLLGSGPSHCLEPTGLRSLGCHS
jgi:hypothetical protein